LKQIKCAIYKLCETGKGYYVYGKHSVKQIHTSLNESEKKLSASFFNEIWRVL